MGDTGLNKQMALFLAHSAELETEAQERYEELAESMREHRNIPVADFFRRMVDEAGRHLEEVAELAADMTLPDLKAWEFDWPDAEAPETTSYEALHYRMSLRQAMQLALDNERAARAYYSDYADNCEDVETAEVARSFAAEESSHVAELERLMAEQPADHPHLWEEDDDPHMPE
ncbi:MAG: ferritin family protein [Pseudomonadales bacterium]|nr:ferritin family protein [Pseudomonadales bacterium]